MWSFVNTFLRAFVNYSVGLLPARILISSLSFPLLRKMMLSELVFLRNYNGRTDGLSVCPSFLWDVGNGKASWSVYFLELRLSA